MTTIIELLRHGEVEGSDVFRGSTDLKLNDTGWDQMNAGIQSAGDWNQIISSPLLRCQEFADYIASTYTLPLDSDKRLQEIDFGNWEGHSPDDILQTDAQTLQNWWDHPTEITPPEGESFLHFRTRVLECWQEIVANYQNQNILIVTHAGVIRVILMKILGMQEENLFRLDVDYASLTRIRIHHDETGDWASLISHG